MALITDRREDTIEERTTYTRINGDVIEGRPTRLSPQDTRVRWGGVMSGFVVALGVLLLMGALGLAIGVTALGDPRTATSATASGLGIGGGVWACITLVAAVFLGSLVSTAVTDQPDRTGAVIHGALVWVMFSLFSVWMIASGISLGVTGLYGAVSGLARGATTAVAAGGGDLVQMLGLNDANQVMQKLDDPTTASTLAAATGISNEDATAALTDLRARVDMVRDDPPRVASEVRQFLAQYAERAKQQAMAAAAAAQRSAKMGAWITVGVMVMSLGVALAGAMAGVPSIRRRWREPMVQIFR